MWRVEGSPRRGLAPLKFSPPLRAAPVVTHSLPVSPTYLKASRVTKAELASILFRARQARIGLRIRTNNPDQLRQKLYPIRKEHPELSPLSFIISPTDPEHILFIVNKTCEEPNGDTEEPRSGEEDTEPSPE